MVAQVTVVRSSIFSLTPVVSLYPCKCLSCYRNHALTAPRGTKPLALLLMLVLRLLTAVMMRTILLLQWRYAFVKASRPTDGLFNRGLATGFTELAGAHIYF